MNKITIASIVVFAALASAGIMLAVNSVHIAQAATAVVVAQIGSALFGGSLAFFLVEMFRWAREWNKGR